MFCIGKYKNDPKNSNKITKSLQQNINDFITINQARVNQYFDSHLAVETMMYCIQNNDIFSVQYDLSNRDNHQEGQGQENN